jgi:hypothetical protein
VDPLVDLSVMFGQVFSDSLDRPFMSNKKYQTRYSVSMRSLLCGHLRDF